MLPSDLIKAVAHADVPPIQVSRGYKYIKPKSNSNIPLLPEERISWHPATIQPRMTDHHGLDQELGSSEAIATLSVRYRKTQLSGMCQFC
jgi:hypothetical protein